MRQEGDPLADGVVRQIFDEGDQAAVDDVFAKITRSDDPIPPGLPGKALAYFEDTAAMPAWADKEQIATAQRMFTRDGWRWRRRCSPRRCRRPTRRATARACSSARPA